MTTFKSAIYLLIITFTLSLFACEKSSCVKCNLEPDPGVCRAHIPKYYFDQEEQKCKEFIWGGCDGLVPFETMEACEACECNS